MSINRLFALMLAVVFSASPLLASAQDASASQRIAVIDVQRALKKSQFVRDALAEQDRKLKNLQNQIDGMLLQYDRLRQDLTRQAAVLSETQLSEKRDELNDLRETIRDKQDDAKELLQTLEDDMITPYIREVVLAAESLAKEEGYDLVLSREVVLYVDAEHDLTDEAAVLLETALQKKAKETDKESDQEENGEKPEDQSASTDKPKLTPSAPNAAKKNVEVLAARIRIGKGETLQEPYIISKSIEAADYEALMITAGEKDLFLNKKLNRTISKGDYILKPLLD
ncbi:OmpH family outer membrane protein [Candidatus Sumerlaeota bacterium]|nr:OmpH family outer membrane protein [Candidatus Sumerlaeota bacterium]